MSEMTLEQALVLDALNEAGRRYPDAANAIAWLSGALVDAHLTRAPVQVTDEDVERALKVFNTSRNYDGNVAGIAMRAALKHFSARLAQPVAVNGLTPDLLGEWCNTLTHAHMYVNERSLENAKHGIELVLDDLREWQEKLSQPHPQAAQDQAITEFYTDRNRGGWAHARAETAGDELRTKAQAAQGGEAHGEAVAWRVVADSGIWDFLNDDERDVVYFDKRDMPSGEELDGFTVTPLYTHPDERAVVPDDGLYYLQDSRSYVGNCPSWWAKDRAGYTTKLDEAHRFTFDEAMRQHRERSTDIPWPCSEIDSLARLTVDMQCMRRIKDQLAKLSAAPTLAGKEKG